MNTPLPPEDDTLKNIIDKLANFVARNGPDFESMTREKQKSNRKFDFLNGGQYHEYYEYMLHNEKYRIDPHGQQLQQQQQQAMITMQPTTIILGQQQQMMALQQLCIQRQDAVDQLKTSEHNLSAQFSSLQQQKQLNIEQNIVTAQEVKLNQMAVEFGLVFSEFDAILQPVIENCSKDSISNGKNFILTHVQTIQQAQTVAHYLQNRIVNPYVHFDTRLHLIYLINDILHHCMRRGVEDMRSALEAVVVSIFCVTHTEVTADKQIKLLKLLNLWDKNNYFDPEIIIQLRDASNAAKTYKTKVLNEYSHLISEANIATTNLYQSMERQHLEFANHLGANISIFDQKIASLKMEVLKRFYVNIKPITAHGATLMQDASSISQQNQSFSGYPPIQTEENNVLQTNIPPPSTPQNGALNQLFDYNHGDKMPDLSQPPPGYSPTIEMDLKPKLPYHALPAALMVPLVEVGERYVSIDAENIRLPAPTAPSDRVLQAVDTFYNPPSRETPRDEDGWETLGLFEFSKMKNESVRNYRLVNSDYSDSNSEEEAEDIEEIKVVKKKVTSPKVVPRYSSLSPERPNSDGYNSGSTREEYSSPGSSDSEDSEDYARDRTTSRSPLGGNSNESYEQIPDEMLGDENKGHQLLKKMGWDGKGLGQDGRGIIDPVKASDVRNKDEKYIGIGTEENHDEYESFRKNRATDYNFKRTGNRRR